MVEVTSQVPVGRKESQARRALCHGGGYQADLTEEMQAKERSVWSVLHANIMHNVRYQRK